MSSPQLSQPLVGGGLAPVPVQSKEEEEAAEKKALCISIASLLLSVPALIGA